MVLIHVEEETKRMIIDLRQVVREAVENVHRHAHAQHFRIHLSVNRQVYIEVTDDGIGIPTKHCTGVGLLSIRERVEQLRGTCAIKSASSGGTHIRCTLPFLSQEEEKNLIEKSF